MREKNQKANPLILAQKSAGGGEVRQPNLMAKGVDLTPLPPKRKGKQQLAAGQQRTQTILPPSTPNPSLRYYLQWRQVGMSLGRGQKQTERKRDRKPKSQPSRLIARLWGGCGESIEGQLNRRFPSQWWLVSGRSRVSWIVQGSGIHSGGNKIIAAP